MTQSIIPMYIDGQFTQGAATWTIPVLNPATQAELGQLPVGTATDVEHAVAAAKAAFIDWRETPVSERARLMMRYQEAVRDHHDALAEIICEDLGKNFEDAKGDVFRGLEVMSKPLALRRPPCVSTRETSHAGLIRTRFISRWVCLPGLRHLTFRQ